MLTKKEKKSVYRIFVWKVIHEIGRITYLAIVFVPHVLLVYQ